MLKPEFADDLGAFVESWNNEAEWLASSDQIHPERWRDTPHRQPYRALNRECGTVLRQLPPELSLKDLFGIARSNDPMALFVSVMAWGYNNDGTGAFRTNRILEPKQAATKISEVIRLASQGKIREAFETIHGLAGVANLGTAFGSKLLYFAGFDRARDTPVPLIFDRLVAIGLARVLDLLHGNSVSWDASTTEWSHYEDYLKLVSRLREIYVPTARLDVVEHWLWLVGEWRGWHFDAIKRNHAWLRTPRRATP